MVIYCDAREHCLLLPAVLRHVRCTGRKIVEKQ